MTFLRCGLVFGLVIAWMGPAVVVAEDDPLRPAAIEARDVPPIPAELIGRLRQYQEVRSAGFRGWAPDGDGILVATRFGNTTQLHRVQTPGGRRAQITFLPEPVNGYFVPKAADGAMVLSLSAGGNENYQIFALDPRTGNPVRLTDGQSRNSLGTFRHDGRQMVITSNRRNGRDTDMYLADPRSPGYGDMILKTDGEYWYPQDWSHDGGTLLINRYVSINETYPALLDLKTRT